MASDASLWITTGIPSGISVLALIVSIYAAVQNRKANKNAGNANAIATGAKDIAEQALDKQGSALKFQDAALENQIYSSINTALQFMIQAAATLGATDPNSSNYGVVQQCYNTTGFVE
ncbi:hypothetical protein [Citrobacter freundii]